MANTFKQKTTWAGIAGMVSAAGGYLTGTMDPQAAVQLFFGSLVAIFLRQGISKNGQGR